ncbi:hypothetical protein TWF696_009358 [Orbilia brochopaga]|uniref:Uncharacterized protein n=1 Tax=Orbilia brochopaga TaxID=3140254 RepID=A0AAV9UET9_9PEZI
MASPASEGTRSTASLQESLNRLSLDDADYPTVLKGAHLEAGFLTEEESQVPAVVLFKFRLPDTHSPFLLPGTALQPLMRERELGVYIYARFDRNFLVLEVWPLEAYDICFQRTDRNKTRQLRGIRIHRGDLIHHGPVRVEDGLEDTFIVDAKTHDITIIGASSGEVKNATILFGEGQLGDKLYEQERWKMAITYRTPTGQLTMWKRTRLKLPRIARGINISDHEEIDDREWDVMFANSTKENPRDYDNIDFEHSQPGESDGDIAMSL